VKESGRVISPGQHSVLDYGLAVTVLAFAFSVLPVIDQLRFSHSQMARWCWGCGC
jgi:hypothetical protein